MTQRKVRTLKGVNLVLRESSYLPDAALPLQLTSSCFLGGSGPLCLRWAATRHFNFPSKVCARRALPRP